MTIPQTVADQFLRVRDTGETNMFDVQNVQRIAHERGLHALVLWIEEHESGAVGKLVMGDAKVDTGEGDPVPFREFA